MISLGRIFTVALASSHFRAPADRAVSGLRVFPYRCNPDAMPVRLLVIRARSRDVQGCLEAAWLARMTHNMEKHCSYTE